MPKPLSRRTTLAALGSAGAGAMTSGLSAAATVAGEPRAWEVSLTTVSPVSVRISVQPVIGGRVAAFADDDVLTPGRWPRPFARWRSPSGEQRFTSGELQLRVTASPFTVRVSDRSGRLVQELSADTGGGLGFRIDDAPVFGLGQGGPQFDRRGDIDPMDAGQGGYRLDTHGAREPIPWLVGTSGWAMFVHHPRGRFEVTAPRGRVVPDTPGAGLDVFVVGSRDPQVLMREYARITGFAEMPPLWSIGYQQSHRTLGSPQEIIAEAKAFRDRKLPCDAMIYLGTGFCPNGWNTDNGEFAWNPRAFPDPKAAIRDLHALDFKVVLHAVIEGETLTGSVKDPCTAPPLPSGRTPDGKWPPNRQAACYWPVHKPLVDMGVDGWWPDQGDGLDAPSRLARNRMYFEGQQLYRPNRRVYALHRNTYAGMQRYAAFLWSGDVKSTWETLRTHVPVAINTGLSGIPYWGTDIGGFVPTQEFTGELYARWFQFGAFNPLFRSHGRDWRMRLPWGWTLGERGYPETKTWNPDPTSLHDERIEPICRKYLELRYRLMPYLYSAVRETCDTGLPIIRALWLHYPDDPQAVACADQYLYGRDILVTPVVERGASSRPIYLPRGAWYDFWTGQRHEGGRTIERRVDLATLPLYVRAGAVIPMGPVKQHTGERSDEPLTLLVHRGADGGGTIYEDDGDSFDYRRGAFSRIEMQWDDAAREISVQRTAGSASESREFQVQVAGAPGLHRLSLRGASAKLRI